MILDGGPVGIGLESTIIDLTSEVPTILRPGYVTQEMLEQVLGSVEIDRTILGEDSSQPPKAPGMKYRHYAPKAELTIFKGNAGNVAAAIKLFEMLGGEVVMNLFLIELKGLEGRKAIGDYPVETVIQYEGA